MPDLTLQPPVSSGTTTTPQTSPQPPLPSPATWLQKAGWAGVLGIGAVAGAGIGALVGGKKHRLLGAGIGAVVGGGAVMGAGAIIGGAKK